ncbi:MAG: hypothetical protein IH596_05730 [Bacteroidales bacterium]|nr:hypothetical protein [Bacteroidales bacterium]
MYKRFAIFSALFGLGFISIATQIYLLREFLYVFQGNELVFGVVLANWMLISGFGAFIGRFGQQMKDRESYFLFLMLLLAVIPVLTIVKLDVWRSVVFPTGSMVGLREIFYSSLLLQTPVCFLSGFLFTALTAILPKKNGQNPLGGAYAMESLGSLIAGGLINFVFLWIIGSFPAMNIISAVFLGCVILYAFSQPLLFPKIMTPLIAGGVLFGLYSISFSSFSLSLLFEDQEVVVDRETPYGRVIVTEQSGQHNVYENGVLLFSSGNVIRDEESVHFAMVQHPNPKRVLLVSGGLSGAIPEILKYKPDRVDYVELNRALMAITSDLGGRIADSAVSYITDDARRYIVHCDKIYDVVLINLPEPSTLQLNRYYTDEFFDALKYRMDSGAILSLSMPTGSDYVSPEAGKLNSCVYNTLKNHFSHVAILPSSKNYFLASDDSLSLAIPSMIIRRGIQTDYVNPYYFDEELLQDRSRFVMGKLSQESSINYDFHPVAYFYQQAYWLSYFRQNYTLVGGMILMVIVFSFLAIDRVNAGVFAAGFTASSTEIILLMGFQIIFGYVYQALGVLIMVFMLGLALGAASRKILFKSIRPRSYLLLQLLMAVVAILVLLFISLVPFLELPDAVVFSAFLFFVLGISFLTGLIFSYAALLSKGGIDKVAASNYAVDLYGAALGALLTTVILLPLLGIKMTLVMLALLNTVTAVWFFVTGRSR